LLAARVFPFNRQFTINLSVTHRTTSCLHPDAQELPPDPTGRETRPADLSTISTLAVKTVPITRGTVRPPTSTSKGKKTTRTTGAATEGPVPTSMADQSGASTTREGWKPRPTSKISTTSWGEETVSPTTVTVASRLRYAAKVLCFNSHC